MNKKHKDAKNNAAKNKYYIVRQDNTKTCNVQNMRVYVH